MSREDSSTGLSALINRPSARTTSWTRGSALVVVMVYMMVLSIFVAGFFSMLRLTMKQSRDTEHRQIALNLAEAGIDKAIAELRAAPDAYRGEQNTRLGDGVFSVEVEAGPQGYTITSTAHEDFPQRRFVHAQVTVHAELTPAGAVQRLHWLEVKQW